MLHRVQPEEAAQARARLLTIGEAERTTRERVRQLWAAAEALASTAAETDATLSRLVLHRHALLLALTALPNQERHGFLPGLAEPGALPVLERLLAAEPVRVADADAVVALGIARTAHRLALERLEADLAVVTTYAQQRWGSLGVVVFVVVAALIGGVSFAQRLLEPADLAAGKPFTLSSSWATCHPDDGECGGVPMKVAFHTNEQDNPWYAVDLGQPAQFSSVSVRNRTDAAMMRAIPLVLEISDDGVTFREIARRDEHFVEWEPRFEPQRARHVRLRVPRVTTLHLEAVRVHP